MTRSAPTACARPSAARASTASSPSKEPTPRLPGPWSVSSCFCCKGQTKSWLAFVAKDKQSHGLFLLQRTNKVMACFCCKGQTKLWLVFVAKNKQSHGLLLLQRTNKVKACFFCKGQTKSWLVFVAKDKVMACFCCKVQTKSWLAFVAKDKQSHGLLLLQRTNKVMAYK